MLCYNLAEEKTVFITEKEIGGTLYIIESAFSSSAKETVYDKVKRLIKNDTNITNFKSAS